MTGRTSPGTSAASSGLPRPFAASRTWFWLPVVLGIVLLGLFIQSFRPGEVLFVNDTTLGQMKAPPNHLPQAFAGTWHNGNWVGMEGVTVAPTISSLLATFLPPEIYLKIFAPFTLFFLGFSAWVFFRQLEFNPAVCVLGGLAAGLNMHFFSIACWGLGSWNMATGMIFLALAALYTKSIPQFWARGLLAGLAVGMNLMEGFDIGAIQCIFFGIFIVWKIFIDWAPGAKKVITGLGTEALVIVFAGFIAAHSISSLVSTQVEGVSGTGQDEQTKEGHWDFATRWSLPKVETLQVVAPGFFGYRMKSRITEPDKSSSYWGTIGRDPRIMDITGADPERKEKAFTGLAMSATQRSLLESPDRSTRDNALRTLLGKFASAARYSGTGEYAGVLVSVLALFGLASSWRGSKSPLSTGERRAIWFWGGVAVISILASWGRYGFFYRLLYQLPYFSTIRNPIKFMHPFHVAWVIMATYGLEAIWRRYMQPGAARTSLVPKTAGFERYWVLASIGVIAAAIVGAFAFNAWKPHLVAYLEQEGFEPQWTMKMADFANTQAVWFIGWLIVSFALVTSALTGAWAGSKAKAIWMAAGLVIIVDLTMADVPWIHYFNYQTEYADNSILEFLQDKPWEHRVIGRLVPKGVGSSISSKMGRLYDYWQQNDFPYRGIQTLDFAQWPRTPELDAAYLKNFSLKGETLATADLWPAERLWELTSTRYILYTTSLASVLKAKADDQHNVRIQTFLSIRAKPNVTYLEDAGEATAVPDPNGDCVLLDFTNALPRAQLYAHWQSPTNDDAVLQTLLARDFDPHHTVLLSQKTPAPQAPADPKADPGTVNITAFRPKYIKLEAHAATPAVLLLNDRVGPEWRALIDHKPAPILRCNYLMRGVFLTPGDHLVEFRFRPSLTTLWLSLAAWGFGLVTAGYLIITRKSVPKTIAASAPAPLPPPPAAPAVKENKAQTPQPTPGGQSRRRRGGK